MASNAGFLNYPRALTKADSADKAAGRFEESGWPFQLITDRGQVSDRYGAATVRRAFLASRYLILSKR